MKKSAGKCGEKGGICGKKKIKSKKVEKVRRALFWRRTQDGERKETFLTKIGAAITKRIIIKISGKYEGEIVDESDPVWYYTIYVCYCGSVGRAADS